MNRIDKIHVYEVVNVLTDAPLDHIDGMGFGKDKDAFLTEPTLLGMGVPFFAQSMHMIADGLGVGIEGIAVSLDAAVATARHPARARSDRARDRRRPAPRVDGDGGRHSRASCSTRSTGLVRPTISIPRWDFGGTQVPHRDRRRSADRARRCRASTRPDGAAAHPGYDWTAMAALNAIPAVCDAPPGWVTNLDLGLVQPRGLVR